MGRGFSRDIKNAFDEFSFRRIFRRAFACSLLMRPRKRRQAAALQTGERNRLRQRLAAALIAPSSHWLTQFAYEP
jgi:hypothetical protein